MDQETIEKKGGSPVKLGAVFKDSWQKLDGMKGRFWALHMVVFLIILLIGFMEGFSILTLFQFGLLQEAFIVSPLFQMINRFVNFYLSMMAGGASFMLVLLYLRDQKMSFNVLMMVAKRLLTLFFCIIVDLFLNYSWLFGADSSRYLLYRH